MNMKILVRIGLLYLLKLMKLFILIVLAKNIFLKKLINLLVIKKLKRVYLDYKHMIQLCVVIFVLSLLTICLKVRHY